MIQPLFKQGRQALVLVVEDNEDHAFLTHAAFEGMACNVTLQQVDNGEKCLAFLRRQAPYESALRPDLILLDTHMPRMNGFEVMQAIADDMVLRSIPVVVLTTSGGTADINRMYQLGCKSYLIKSGDFEDFSEALEQLMRYWFGLVLLADVTA